MTERIFAPLVPEVLEAIIARERPTPCCPRWHRRGLTREYNLAKSGYLQRHNVTLLALTNEAILKAETVEQFKQAMERTIAAPRRICGSHGGRSQ
ncbi:MAG: hypothetical protein H6715_04615 [Myxococcales bacterium]|nr:hypothetical protein [Myxococcales bacterium]